MKLTTGTHTPLTVAAERAMKFRLGDTMFISSWHWLRQGDTMFISSWHWLRQLKKQTY
jgi:hypothetical protein